MENESDRRRRRGRVRRRGGPRGARRGAAGDAQAAAQAPPVNGSAPTISGIARVGRRLTAERGDWSNGATSYAYQWQRCNASGRPSCVNIAGETGERRDITATTSETRSASASSPPTPTGRRAAFSAPTAVIQPAVAPAITRLPAITGTARVGRADDRSRRVGQQPHLVRLPVAAVQRRRRPCVEHPRRERAEPHPHPGRQGSRLRVLSRPRTPAVRAPPSRLRATSSRPPAPAPRTRRLRRSAARRRQARP